MRKIHRFYSTSEAYDACQTRDDVHDGDTLLVERERVAGVAGTWPVAVTEAAGALGQLAPGARCPDGWREAARLARARGWPVHSVDADATADDAARVASGLESARARFPTLAAEGGDEWRRYLERNLETLETMDRNLRRRLARPPRRRGRGARP